MKSEIIILLFLVLSLNCKHQNSNNPQEKNHKERKEAITNNDEDYQTEIETGRYYLQLNQIDSAIISFKKAIALNPNKPDGHYGIGVAKAISCYKNGNECYDAIDHLKKTISLEPNFRKANFNIGTCYISLKNYSKAITYLDKAIEQDSTNGEYYMNRGFAKLQTGNKDSSACRDFSLAVKYDYKEAEALLKENCN